MPTESAWSPLDIDHGSGVATRETQANGVWTDDNRLYRSSRISRLIEGIGEMEATATDTSSVEVRMQEDKPPAWVNSFMKWVPIFRLCRGRKPLGLRVVATGNRSIPTVHPQLSRLA